MKSKPRVLHWVTHLGLGGAERVAQSLIEGMQEGWTTGLFAVEGRADNAPGDAMAGALLVAGAALYLGPRVPAKRGGMLLAALRGARVVRAFRPDVIHLHTEIPEAAYAMMIALRAGAHGVPLVRTIHNSRYWHHWPRLGGWCERRMACSFVACVSADAQSAFQHFRRRAGVGPSAAPAPRVIYNGVRNPGARPRPATDPSRPMRILFAGRFEEQKGTDLLPEILPRLQTRTTPGWELVLHGSGSHEPLLHALSRQAPPGWTIHVQPPVADLPSRLSEFDLVIVPSRFEGLGLVAVESLLAGVPVVITDAEGLRETVPSDYPWRARAGDAASFAAMLDCALAQTARWPAVVAAAQAFATDRFDFSSMGDRYAALYRQAIAGR